MILNIPFFSLKPDVGLLFLHLSGPLLVLTANAGWILLQGRLGWLLVILFSTIALAEPGHFVISPSTKGLAV